MPRTAEQFAAMQDASREEILRAALELFAEHGFDKTSVQMIAKKAGISQGLTYNYFAGKDDLLRTIFERGMADVRESFRPPLPSGSSVKPSLFDFIENTCRLTLKHRDFWRLVNSIRTQPVVLDRLGSDIAGFEQMILERLEVFCRASLSPDPVAEARLLFALVDGLCMHLVRNPDAYPLDEVLAIVRSLYGSRLLPDDEEPGEIHRRQ